MREIKFRSFDKRKGGMDYPDHIANFINGDKCQIMQYTGLKDKNGKEIYEGDIVKFRFYQKWVIAQVKISEYGLFLTSCTGNGAWFYRDIHQRSTLEVIGDIYSNPELLGEQSIDIPAQ